MVNTKDIEKLATLARIHISPSECEHLKTEIGSILSYVEQVQEVSATQGSDKKRKDHVNIMREDDISHETGAFKENLIDAAPHNEKGYIKVKKIL